MLLVVSWLTFWLLGAAGGDALTALQAEPHVSARALARMRAVYGLDEPLATRYLRWLADAARGRFGESFYYQVPVAQLLWPRFWRTLALTAAAFSLAWALALALGGLAARRMGGWAWRVSEVVILCSASVPPLVIALAALMLAARTGLFRVGVASVALADDLTPGRLLPPAVVLALPFVAVFLAQTREGLRHALAEEFVRVARAKGLRERAVMFRHALRAALNPLLTVGGHALGGLMSGAVIVEPVLGWSGLGQLTVVAVRQRDVPLLLAAVLVTATAVLVGNLLADMLLRWNDPRLREAGATTNAAPVSPDSASAPAA